MDDKLQKAIQAIEAGDTNNGSVLLAQAIRADPKNESAWYWMAIVQDDLQKKKQCLQRVIQLNPGNAEACQGLELLEASEIWPTVQAPEPEPVPEPTQEWRLEPAAEVTPEAETAESPVMVPEAASVPEMAPASLEAAPIEPAAVAPEETPTPAETPQEDWFSGIASGPAAESPDWLKDIGAIAPAPVSAVPAAPEAPDWLKDLGLGGAQSEAPQTEQPDWLDGISADAGVSGTGADLIPDDNIAAGSTFAAEPASGEQELQDWLSGVSPTQPPAAADGQPDWMAGASAFESQEPTVEPAQPGEVPDWLSSYQKGAPEEPPAPEPAAQAGGVPDWLSSFKFSTPAFTEEEPSTDEEEPEPQAGYEVPSWQTSGTEQTQARDLASPKPAEEAALEEEAASTQNSVAPFSMEYDQYDQPDMSARMRRATRKQQPGPLGLTRSQVIFLIVLGVMAILFLIVAIAIFAGAFTNGLI